MEYLGTRQMGRFSHAGETLAPATRPWITDLSALCPFDGLAPGNIPEFETDPDWGNWALTDSPADPSQRLNWHVFQGLMMTSRLSIKTTMLSLSGKKKPILKAIKVKPFLLIQTFIKG